MKNIMDLFRSLTPEGNGNRQQKGYEESVTTETQPIAEKLSNQVILQKILGLFRNDLVENSFEEVVTFPMTFTIAMAERDFDKFKGYMPLIAQLAVKNFYRIIKEEMGKDRSCANMATYWDISFIPCIPGVTELEEEPVDIPEGKIAVLSTVNDTIEDITGSDGVSNVSLTVSGSEIYGNVNINRNILTNLKVVDATHFRINWDANLSENFKQPVAQNYAADKNSQPETGKPVGGIIAYLTCNYNGQRAEFKMERNTCTISGSGDARTDATIFKIPCKMVKAGHIHIQYIEKNDKFMLSAYGKTMVNSAEIKQSSGADVNWVELPAQATLNLNGVVMVKFKKMK